MFVCKGVGGGEGSLGLGSWAKGEEEAAPGPGWWLGR